ncbi:helix-turn-helix domain-containing protein [Sphingobium sp. HBC34]|uniref:Helix-turn-helix domain-containing protein n=1 Tax=Sphingobium cyanobacteriorum TaxID=3063954 RepID=A0ABT8ZS57_9SPHN|nr:helix-turn-helix domain-containing protein [Sphingobium sp. HBC34]MDO7837379.1 helix-turn-helix domain-containing protein [Sphingobium sp. HBC34]
MRRRAGTKANEEKRREIISAFIDSLIDRGLDQSTMGEVAARVGLDRSTLHYYFRTRDELVLEAADEISLRYLKQFKANMALAGRDDRAEKLIDLLFNGTFHQPDLSIALEELGVLANRNPAVDRRVSGIYRAIEHAIIEEIEAIFPDAPKRARRDIALAISQLSEGCTVFVSMNFGADRSRAAHRAAKLLVASLVK